MGERHLVRFDKEITKIIKGFAIIFMLILHCYGRINYDTELSYQYYPLNGFHGSFKICVGIFNFLVGYGYAFSKTKDWRYSVQHIKKLLIPYWTILFVFSVPVCISTILKNDLITFIYSLIGITDGVPVIYLHFSWFVHFFIYAMIVMPFISRFINKRPLIHSIIAIVATFSIGILFHEIPRFLSLINIIVPRVADTSFPLAIFNCLMMSPLMILGYLFAHEGYYEKIDISKISDFWIAVICISTIVVIMTVLRPYTFNVNNPFNLDFFYAPIVIGAIAVFFNKFRCQYFRMVMVKIGEVSVYMWFFHALFYTQVIRSFYQPVITIFNDINLVVLWTIVLTFFASWLIKSIVETITKRLGLL